MPLSALERRATKAVETLLTWGEKAGWGRSSAVTGLYDRLAAKSGQVRFLNYGYSPADKDLRPPGGGSSDVSNNGAAAVEAPPQNVELFSLTLYMRVFDAAAAAASPRKGAKVRVLDVGCGRGAGLLELAKIHPDFEYTGVDLSQGNIDTAQNVAGPEHASNITWVCGNAEELPFPDGSFDIVVNVESSHCYPHFDAFVSEVARVLRPGGAFSIADMRAGDGAAGSGGVLPAVSDYEDIMGTKTGDAAAGRLTLVNHEDITAAVVESRQAVSETVLGRMRSKLPLASFNPVFYVMALFAGVEGTPIYARFKNRNSVYVQSVLRRSDAI